MKRYIYVIISIFAITVYSSADTKIAILPIVDVEGNVSYGIKFQMRNSFTYAINNTSGYQGVDRVDISSIINEQIFQRNGNISIDQVQKIGTAAGVQYILISEAALYDAQNIIFTANIWDVESGNIIVSTSPQITNSTPDKIQDACAKIVQTCLSSVKSNQKPTHSDYVENVLGINMKMIWVEGGKFMMGCTPEIGIQNCGDGEQIVRQITLDGFYIGMCEVSQAQYAKVMGGDYAYGPDYPVYRISRTSMMDFCNKLSKMTGKTYTLPTEAQWEYAARGGNKSEGTRYSGSNSIDIVGWYDNNSGDHAHPCGTKRSNALGIYDMSGNVFELCLDYYKYEYDKDDTNNPSGPSSPNYYSYSTDYVMRGGSYRRSQANAIVSKRNVFKERFDTSCDIDLGFRVVCIP